MANFEQFIIDGVVYKRQIDVAIARFTISDAKARFERAKKDMNSSPKFAFEDAYEAVIELINALLAKDGYKSYSHEANIAFLGKFKEFSVADLENLNRIRGIRHKCKYYGKPVSPEEAKYNSKFLEVIFDKILKRLNK